MPRSYAHLDLDERRRLAEWRAAKIPVKEIALRLGRDAPTLYRELKRNFFRDVELPELNGYHAVAAQDMAERRRAVHRKMVVHPTLKLAVVDRLKAGWSPEQIAGRMRLERHPVRVSHETIYRFAYSERVCEKVATMASRHMFSSRTTRETIVPPVYPTDLTDAQRALIAPHLPAPRPSGRTRRTDLRAVVNEIFYLLRTGCQWRLLPKDFPPWGRSGGTFVAGGSTASGPDCIARSTAQPGDMPAGGPILRWRSWTASL